MHVQNLFNKNVEWNSSNFEISIFYYFFYNLSRIYSTELFLCIIFSVSSFMDNKKVFRKEKYGVTGLVL